MKIAILDDWQDVAGVANARAIVINQENVATGKMEPL
jgi:hypothetical protein